MKKLILPIALMLLLTLGVQLQSQAQMSGGISIGYGIPMGDMGDDAKGGLKNGFLIDLQGRHQLNDNMAVGLNIGYNMWSLTTVPSGMTASFTTMPIMAAFDYTFSTDRIKPFVGLELGYTTWNAKVSITGLGDFNQSGGGLALAPNGGVAYAINDDLDLFGKVKYFYGMTEDSGKGSSNLTYLAINIGAAMRF